MSRRAWLIALIVLVLGGGYLTYDWSRPCVGGPVHGFVKAAVNGGHYTVRCAG